MTPLKRGTSTSAVAWLTLVLAGCSGETGPTGWIPGDGSVAWVITVTSGPLMATRPSGNAVESTNRRGELPFPAPPRPTFTRAAALARTFGTGPLRAAGPVPTTSDLIVTFHHS